MINENLFDTLKSSETPSLKNSENEEDITSIRKKLLEVKKMSKKNSIKSQNYEIINNFNFPILNKGSYNSGMESMFGANMVLNPIIKNSPYKNQTKISKNLLLF
jgi:hypothetical protein